MVDWVRNRCAFHDRGRFAKMGVVARANQHLASRELLPLSVQPLLVLGARHHFGTGLRTLSLSGNNPVPGSWLIFGGVYRAPGWGRFIWSRIWALGHVMGFGAPRPKIRRSS